MTEWQTKNSHPQGTRVQLAVPPYLMQEMHPAPFPVNGGHPANPTDCSGLQFEGGNGQGSLTRFQPGRILSGYDTGVSRVLRITIGHYSTYEKLYAFPVIMSIKPALSTSGATVLPAASGWQSARPYWSAIRAVDAASQVRPLPYRPGSENGLAG